LPPSDAEIGSWAVELLEEMKGSEHTGRRWDQIGLVVSELAEAAAARDRPAMLDAIAELESYGSHRGPVPLQPAPSAPGGAGGADGRAADVPEVRIKIPPRIGAEVERAIRELGRFAGAAGQGTGPG